MRALVNNLEIQLTHREFKVIHFLIEGNTAEMVGKKIFLSKRSVEAIIKNLKKKFNCNTLLHLGFVLGFFHVIEQRE